MEWLSVRRSEPIIAEDGEKDNAGIDDCPPLVCAPDLTTIDGFTSSWTSPWIVGQLLLFPDRYPCLLGKFPLPHRHIREAGT